MAKWKRSKSYIYSDHQIIFKVLSLSKEKQSVNFMELIVALLTLMELDIGMEGIYKESKFNSKKNHCSLILETEAISKNWKVEKFMKLNNKNKEYKKCKEEMLSLDNSLRINETCFIIQRHDRCFLSSLSFINIKIQILNVHIKTQKRIKKQEK